MIAEAFSGTIFSHPDFPVRILASDHKYLRICDLCKELGIACLHAHIAAERERQAKTDAGLVPLCPLASMVPAFWRRIVWSQPEGGSGRRDPLAVLGNTIPPP